MEVKEAILNRKSIRKYLPKPVEREKLERLIELSRRSPTWKNAQGYSTCRCFFLNGKGNGLLA